MKLLAKVLDVTFMVVFFGAFAVAVLASSYGLTGIVIRHFSPPCQCQGETP